MMRILVTGGAGFIGRHLVKLLLNQGHKVTIFDNFSNSKKSSLSSLIVLGVNVIEGDITNKKEVSLVMKNQQVVIHLAAKISVTESIKNPQETMHVNVDGTINILEECKKNKVENIIIISSAAVYGEAETHETILDEEHKTNPLSPYGKSKIIMERETRDFAEKNKINCIIFRIFNIYGNGQSKEYAGVITKFASRIHNDEPLVVYGDGNQTRDFVSIDDVTSVINSSISIYGKFGRIYNIAYGKSTTIKNLADMMLKISGKKLTIKCLESNEGDIKFSQASIERAKNELGYLPKISLEAGIRKFMYDFQS